MLLTLGVGYDDYEGLSVASSQRPGVVPELSDGCHTDCVIQPSDNLDAEVPPWTGSGRYAAPGRCMNVPPVTRVPSRECPHRPSPESPSPESPSPSAARTSSGIGCGSTGGVGVHVRRLDRAARPAAGPDVEREGGAGPADLRAADVNVDDIAPVAGALHVSVDDTSRTSETNSRRPALLAVRAHRLVAVEQVVGVEHDALLVDLGVAHGRRPGAAARSARSCVQSAVPCAAAAQTGHNGRASAPVAQWQRQTP